MLIKVLVISPRGRRERFSYSPITHHDISHRGEEVFAPLHFDSKSAGDHFFVSLLLVVSLFILVDVSCARSTNFWNTFLIGG